LHAATKERAGAEIHTDEEQKDCMQTDKDMQDMQADEHALPCSTDGMPASPGQKRL